MSLESTPRNWYNFKIYGHLLFEYTKNTEVLYYTIIFTYRFKCLNSLKLNNLSCINNFE